MRMIVGRFGYIEIRFVNGFMGASSGRVGRYSDPRGISQCLTCYLENST
jgi:hypothetical protein